MTENTRDRRREARAAARVAVEVAGEGRRERLTTLDVSPRGVFVGTERPWPLHAPLELRLELPDGDPIAARGVVVRTRPPDDGRSGHEAGMGVQFAALSAEDQARWEAFCRRLATADDRRRFDRRPARLRVAVQAETAADLEAFWTRNISPGGALFETDAPFEPGMELEMLFTHPDTGARATIRGRVVRRDETGAVARVAVEFDPPEVEAFRRLIGH